MDMRIVELMCSRLCHDLVSPVGAIRNGLELLEDTEDDGGFAGEAIQLIAHSAAQADRRLRLFRLAYGQAGRDVKDFEDIRGTAALWLEGGRTTLAWTPGAVPAGLAARRGLAKTLLNVIMLAEEALPTGGTIGVTGTGSDASGSVTVTLEGRSVRLTPDALEALEGGEAAKEDLSPRTVHAFATGRFAATFRLALRFAAGDAGRGRFDLSW
jgi:histidine phosphotransferase ChpT